MARTKIKWEFFSPSKFRKNQLASFGIRIRTIERNRITDTTNFI